MVYESVLGSIAFFQFTKSGLRRAGEYVDNKAKEYEEAGFADKVKNLSVVAVEPNDILKIDKESYDKLKKYYTYGDYGVQTDHPSISYTDDDDTTPDESYGRYIRS